MSVKPPTQNEKDILNAIISYIAAHQYPPTVREICEMTGYRSTSTVHGHLSSMATKGMIEIHCSGAPRAIRVPGYKFVKVEGGNQNEQRKD